MATNRASSPWVAPFGGSDSPHCGDMSFRTLRLRVAIVQGDELAQLTLPCSSSAASFEPRRKVPRVSDAYLSGSGDEHAPAQCPRAPQPPAADPLPVRFMTADLRPSPTLKMWCLSVPWRALKRRMMTFRWLRLRERSGLTARWITLRPTAATRDLHHNDVELLSVLSKAVDEFGLEWAPPAEPTRSRLDEWYLQLIAAERTPRGDPDPFS